MELRTAMEKHIAKHPPINNYFESIIERDKDRPRLKVLGTKCHDCAVDCLYHEISCDLKQESPEVIREVSEKWWCHNSPNRACRGNWENVGLPCQWIKTMQRFIEF